MNTTFYIVHSTGQERGPLTEQNAFTFKRDALKHYDRQRDTPAILERHTHSKATLANGIPKNRKFTRLKSKNL